MKEDDVAMVELDVNQIVARSSIFVGYEEGDEFDGGK